MHSIIGESFTELISKDVPHRAGIASLVKHILKQQIRAVLKICKLQIFQLMTYQCRQFNSTIIGPFTTQDYVTNSVPKATEHVIILSSTLFLMMYKENNGRVGTASEKEGRGGGGGGAESE